MHILGSDVARWRNLRIWAERGMVHIEDARDNSYEVHPVRTMLHRVKAINDMLGNSRADRKGFVDEDFRAALQRFVEDAVAVIQKAREQGEPFDDASRREAKRRQPKTVCVPTGKSLF